MVWACLGDEEQVFLFQHHPRSVGDDQWHAPWGYSHMSADIICLSIDPLFGHKSYTFNDPVFHYSQHPMAPLKKKKKKISIKFHSFFFFFARFMRILKISSIFSQKLQIFTQIWQNLTWWPLIWKIHTHTQNTKKLISHPMTTFYLRNPTMNAPCFPSSLIGTCLSLSFCAPLPRCGG